MNRQPVVAGQFYPGNARSLRLEVSEYLQGEPSAEKTLLAMAPHAGYVFSGSTAGKTFARSRLAQKIILIGPNHTGRGEKIAVWPEGNWSLPGLEVPIDPQLVQAVLNIPGFIADHEAHTREHSLEVILPFLSAVLNGFSMAPIAVAEPDPEVLLAAGKNLGLALKNLGEDVSLVVSSDMSHYISHQQAEKIDRLAIDPILNIDPEDLYRVVLANRISMCGVLPMVLGLACVRELGAKKSLLVDYSTSGEVNHDYSRVVGYAGILIS